MGFETIHSARRICSRNFFVDPFVRDRQIRQVRAEYILIHKQLLSDLPAIIGKASEQRPA